MIKSRFFMFPVFFLGISFAFPESCDSRNKSLPQPKSSDVIYEVYTVFPRFVDFSRTVSGTGTFSASDKLVVKAEMSGVIERVNVGEGDKIATGDPLAQFRKEELTATVDKKQAELREAEAILERDQKIYNQHGESPPPPGEVREAIFLDEEQKPAPKLPEAPQKTEGEVEGQAATMASRVKLEEATVERIKKELALLEEQIQKLVLYAPISGIIQKRNVTDGSVVQITDPLFEIVTLNPITLSFHVPQEASSYIDKFVKAEGMPREAPELKTEGTIYYISPSVDTARRTLEIRMHLPNDKGLVREGQEGRGFVSTHKVEKVLVVPREAVVSDGGNNFIYVVNGNQVQKTAVKKGQEIGNDLEIEANIRIDDPVVLSGQSSLKDGSFVRIKESLPITPLPQNS